MHQVEDIIRSQNSIDVSYSQFTYTLYDNVKYNC